MLAVDIWCGEVKTHLEADAGSAGPPSGHRQSYEHPVAGRVKVVGPAVTLTATPASIDRPAPQVGEHTREILAEFGYGGAEVDALIARGVAGTVNREAGGE